MIAKPLLLKREIKPKALRHTDNVVTYILIFFLYWINLVYLLTEVGKSSEVPFLGISNVVPQYSLLEKEHNKTKLKRYLVTEEKRSYGIPFLKEQYHLVAKACHRAYQNP